MLKTDVDYGYYVNSFSDGAEPKLSALDFYIGSSRAKAFLNSIINCEEPDGVETNIKDCLCCLAEEICRIIAQKGIKSENIDGYSVTFYEDRSGRDLVKIVNIYLGNQGLVFAGVDA